MTWYGPKNPYQTDSYVSIWLLDNSATGLPTPPQEPIYKSISPEWETMDDTGSDIPYLICISEEVLFPDYTPPPWVEIMLKLLT